MFLKSLLEYIQQKFNKNFSNITITDPQISQEKDRIDLLVLDKNYSIIFENKIYDAKDQDQQISRYIEKVKDKNYKDECIYIVYLTNFYKTPSRDTWRKTKEKNVFSTRYCNLSYKFDILPWLESISSNSNIVIKEIELQSAIEQYIGYLRILLNNNTMEKELEGIFKEKLNGDLKKSIDSLEKIQKLEEGHLEYIRVIIQNQIDKWMTDNNVKVERAKESRPEVNPLVIVLAIGDDFYWLYIQIDESCKSIRCCFEIKNKEHTLISKRSNKIKAIMNCFGDEGIKEDYKFYSERKLSKDKALESALKQFVKIKGIAEK